MADRPRRARPDDTWAADEPKFLQIQDEIATVVGMNVKVTAVVADRPEVQEAVLALSADTCYRRRSEVVAFAIVTELLNTDCTD